MRCVCACAFVVRGYARSCFCADCLSCPPRTKKIFSLFFFFFFSRLKFLHLFLPFLLSKRKPLSPRSFSSLFLCRVRPSWRPMTASHLTKEEKKASGCTFFLSSSSSCSSSSSHIHRLDIYTHTHVYIQTHTHTLYIRINNGIRNDQLFVDAVRRVVGLLFFLEKKFDDQQPIIRCF